MKKFISALIICLLITPVAFLMTGCNRGGGDNDELSLAQIRVAVNAILSDFTGQDLREPLANNINVQAKSFSSFVNTVSQTSGDDDLVAGRTIDQSMMMNVAMLYYLVNNPDFSISNNMKPIREVVGWDILQNFPFLASTESIFTFEGIWFRTSKGQGTIEAFVRQTIYEVGVELRPFEVYFKIFFDFDKWEQDNSVEDYKITNIRRFERDEKANNSWLYSNYGIETTVTLFNLTTEKTGNEFIYELFDLTFELGNPNSFNNLTKEQILNIEHVKRINNDLLFNIRKSQGFLATAETNWEFTEYVGYTDAELEQAREVLASDTILSPIRNRNLSEANTDEGEFFVSWLQFVMSLLAG